jgi:NitT/TauT family transport system substrate-binding protein
MARIPTPRPLRARAAAIVCLLGSSLVLPTAIPAGAQQTVSPSETVSATASPAVVTPLAVGLGYIPSVQFAQFYLAEQAGYYDEAGLDVTFQNKPDPELVTLVAEGAVDVGIADGTSVIPAVSQGIPVVYAATIYGRDPNVVFSLADTGIAQAADLAGRSVGIPGRYGSSWVALQALLASAGLSLDDISVVTYPDYGQAVAVAAGRVDAATGFINNEPVQLRLQGLDINVLQIADIAPRPGPGLIVGTATLEAKGEALRGFTAATLRAMTEITADPQLGLDATFARVPELAADPATQRAILEATITAWSGQYQAAHGLGAIDPEVWDAGVRIMAALPDSAVRQGLTTDELITDALLPQR